MVQSVATRCRPVGTLDRWLVCEEGRGSQLDTQLGSRLAFSPTPSQASWHPCICLLLVVVLVVVTFLRRLRH